MECEREGLVGLSLEHTRSLTNKVILVRMMMATVVLVRPKFGLTFATFVAREGSV